MSQTYPHSSQGVCAACGYWHTIGGPCPTRDMYQQMPSVLSPVHGCICPPGANLQCENPMCPRKKPGWQP